MKFEKEEIKSKRVNKLTSFTKNKKVIKCQQVHLYVGYDVKKDVTTDFTWKVMDPSRHFSSVSSVELVPQASLWYSCSVSVVSL